MKNKDVLVHFVSIPRSKTFETWKMCLFRVCCDCDADDSDDEETLNQTRLRNAAGPSRMSRQDELATSDAHYHGVSTAITVENARGAVDSDDPPCCQPNCGENSQESRIHGFLRRLQESWRKYDSLESFSAETVSFASAPETNGKAVASPLRTALHFDLTKDSVYPTIRPEEVVLPGSSLQKEMSQAMNIEEQGDECVICMEGFDETNPRMPTLCGCGENRTYFHLPCLYQWVEQSSSCPSCRQRLQWDEF